MKNCTKAFLFVLSPFLMTQTLASEEKEVFEFKVPNPSITYLLLQMTSNDTSDPRFCLYRKEKRDKNSEQGDIDFAFPRKKNVFVGGEAFFNNHLSRSFSNRYTAQRNQALLRAVENAPGVKDQVNHLLSSLAQLEHDVELFNRNAYFAENIINISSFHDPDIEHFYFPNANDYLKVEFKTEKGRSSGIPVNISEQEPPDVFVKAINEKFPEKDPEIIKSISQTKWLSIRTEIFCKNSFWNKNAQARIALLRKTLNTLQDSAKALPIKRTPLAKQNPKSLPSWTQETDAELDALIQRSQDLLTSFESLLRTLYHTHDFNDGSQAYVDSLYLPWMKLFEVVNDKTATGTSKTKTTLEATMSHPQTIQVAIDAFDSALNDPTFQNNSLECPSPTSIYPLSN